MRRKAPMIITTMLALLTAAILAIVIMQPAPTERAMIVNAERIPQGGLHTNVTTYADESELQHAGKADLPRTANGLIKVPFVTLSGFPYMTPTPQQLQENPDPMARIPENVASLDGERVLLLGNMVPAQMDDSGNVTGFFLTQNQQYCCYGETPQMNELAYVTLRPGAKAPAYTEKPIAVAGILDVGEDSADGYVASVYRVEATEILPPSAYTDN